MCSFRVFAQSKHEFLNSESDPPTKSMRRWSSNVAAFVLLWGHTRNMLLFAFKVKSWLPDDLVCSLQCKQRLEQTCVDGLLSHVALGIILKKPRWEIGITVASCAANGVGVMEPVLIKRFTVNVPWAPQLSLLNYGLAKYSRSLSSLASLRLFIFGGQPSLY